MAQAGVISAILNVKINLASIKDEKFVKQISLELNKLQNSADKKTSDILKIVNSKI